MRHYHELLEFGLDPRREGLSWIIKSIWLLEETINHSKFPKWLDKESCEYLMKVS